MFSPRAWGLRRGKVVSEQTYEESWGGSAPGVAPRSIRAMQPAWPGGNFGVKYGGSGTEPQGEVALGAGISPAQARSCAHRCYLRVLLLGTGLSALPSCVPAPGGTAPAIPSPSPSWCLPGAASMLSPHAQVEAPSSVPAPSLASGLPISPFPLRSQFQPARGSPPHLSTFLRDSLWAFCRVCPPRGLLEAELGRKKPSRASWGCSGLTQPQAGWGGGHGVGSRPAGEQGWSGAGGPQVVEVALLRVRAPKGDVLTSWSPPRPLAQPLGVISFRGLCHPCPSPDGRGDAEWDGDVGTWGRWGPGLPRSQGRRPTRVHAPKLSHGAHELGACPAGLFQAHLGLTWANPGGSHGATGHGSAPFPKCRAGLKSSREGW